MSQTPLAALVETTRKAQGYSLETLAKEAGCSWRTIWNLENDYSAAPRGETLRGIAKALGLDVKELTSLLEVAS